MFDSRFLTLPSLLSHSPVPPGILSHLLIVCTTIPIVVFSLADLTFPGLAVTCFPKSGRLVLPHQIALADLFGP